MEKSIIRTTSAIIAGEKQQTVNARELWRKLGSRREFATWIKDRLQDFTEGQDFSLDKIVKRRNHGGTTATEYILTLDTAKHLCMLERNEAGKKIRQYFIEIEKEFRRQDVQRHSQPSNDVLMATLYAEMERRIKAETERDEMEKNLRRIAVASNLNFGEISNSTGLPKDIVVAAHCKSSKREHKPQVNRYIQLILPMREIVEACYKQLNAGAAQR